jgi:hypothetical protein
MPNFCKNTYNNDNKGRKARVEEEGKKPHSWVQRPSKSVPAKRLDTNSLSTWQGFGQLFTKQKYVV